MKRFSSIMIFLLDLSLLLPTMVMAKSIYNNSLYFGTNIRFRYEYQNNFNIKSYSDHPVVGKADDSFLLGRFRTGIDYWYTKNLHLKLWLQDSRVWGLNISDNRFYKYNFNREHNPYRDPFELWDSYLEIKSPFDVPLRIRAGRQRIYFGDNRVFGPGQWGNTGSWIWDAVRASYTFNQDAFDVFYGRTEIHDPHDFSLNHRHGYECLGFYGHLDIYKKLLWIEPFSMTKRDTHKRYKGEDGRFGDLNSYYIGMRGYINDLKGFFLDLTYLTQRGDYARDTIRAYAYHILFGYKFDSLYFKPKVSGEYSYASGDSNPYDHTHETFDAAYGSRDKAYGRMNLFKWENLRDEELNLELYPTKSTYCKLEFHRFYLAEKKDAWYLNPKAYRDKTGNSGDRVGSEFDIVTRFKIYKKDEIQMGYGHFWPSEFAKKIASNSQADWVFVMLVYNFSTKLF